MEKRIGYDAAALFVPSRRLVIVGNAGRLDESIGPSALGIVHAIARENPQLTSMGTLAQKIYSFDNIFSRGALFSAVDRIRRTTAPYNFIVRRYDELLQEWGYGIGQPEDFVVTHEKYRRLK
jgi:hypothetical protein